MRVPLLLLLVGPLAAQTVDVGSRPAELVRQLPDGELKSALDACDGGPFHKTKFAIGHRGAPLRFPEHTRQSYEAAARQGAGVIECDVAFTSDRKLVCRHSHCDLHTTTNILVTDLAGRCSEPFRPASGGEPASARCCTTDLTLAEFRSLCGKQDGANVEAATPAEYVGEIDGCGELLTHAESIALFQELGVEMTPELKTPAVEMPYQGFTQEQFAQQLIDEYREAGVTADQVRPQSFRLEDVEYWLEHAPEFGSRAVYLDPVREPDDLPAAIARFPALYEKGVRVLGPPLWALLTVEEGRRAPSDYARAAKAAGFDIIAWSLERSGETLARGEPDWYHQTTASILRNESDYLDELDVLAREIDALAVFSDWPATVVFYANCRGVGSPATVP